NSYNVFIGNGQPLVMATQTFRLTVAPHDSDKQRLQVGYVVNNSTQLLPESTLSGGRLGGLLEFRSRTLDATQNELGRVAAALAMSFNEQHRLGLDQNGQPGGDFFSLTTQRSVTGKPGGQISFTLNDPS